MPLVFKIQDPLYTIMSVCGHSRMDGGCGSATSAGSRCILVRMVIHRVRQNIHGNVFVSS